MPGASRIGAQVRTGNEIVETVSRLPSRVAFQRATLRYRREGDPTPPALRRPNESRHTWLLRLAAHGFRPLRPAWRADDRARPKDRFGWVTVPVPEAPPGLLSPLVAEADRWTRGTEAAFSSSTCWCTVGATAPGRVPDGVVLLGSLLSVRRITGAPSVLELRWGPSCSADAVDYSIHEGTLGSWYSHDPALCTTGGIRTRTIVPRPGNCYYVIVPLSLDAEGSYGVDARRIERPRSLHPCRPISHPTPCP